MSPRTNPTSRLARALTAHAVRVAGPDSAEWATAMMHEQEHLPPDASALSWAFGCVSVSYRGRLRAMFRFPAPLRWVALFILFLVSLGPPLANFIQIAVSTAQGHPLSWAATLHLSVLQEGLIFGSATLIGPIGVVAALWTLLSRAHRPGRTFMVVLWTLTAWAAVYVGLPAQSAEWRALATSRAIFSLILSFVLLPALGVALLQWLDARRRRLAD
ncbi:MAG TPA: hypothetical protein VGV09_18725 [Steroidobacteraceae bacterium]|nr:hypothetical protein [Steroidobacteraceae bacterium]